MISKRRFTIYYFAAVALLLAGKTVYRCAGNGTEASPQQTDDTPPQPTRGLDKPVTDRTKHKIYSVSSYKDCFPDDNNVQMASARHLGVPPVADRQDAERRKTELVYIGYSPYYRVDRLRNSIPYLVPRAAQLLHDIGKNFYDSLYLKRIPLHKPIVTSVLRTREDISKLKTHNGNATDNSCHLYGTTFDLCYNRYERVCDPDSATARCTTNDSLKWVLSEVVNDLRQSGRCWVKYEVKQGCFHITAR